MSEVLDRLKEGHAEALKRHAEVTKRWQAATAEMNVANAEVAGYNKVIELETRRELQKAASAPPVVEPSVPPEPVKTENETINKTQLVRNALAEHPGLTPAQLYGALKAQMPRRNYVYSVLKRLKDRKQVIERRGKYYLPPTPKVEEDEQTTIVQ